MEQIIYILIYNVKFRKIDDSYLFNFNGKNTLSN